MKKSEHPPLREFESLLSFGSVSKCCGGCRYYRIHKSSAYTSECLLLGRTLGVSNYLSAFHYWDGCRVCDGWRKRPSGWDVHTSNNPHWEDPHYKREQLKKMAWRLYTTMSRQPRPTPEKERG